MDNLDFINYIEKSVVKIECIPEEDNENKKIGTGFFIDKNIIITAGHIIDICYKDSCNINIITYKKEIFKATIKDTCKKDDLISILELESCIEGINTLSFTKNYNIHENDEYLIFGYPKLRSIGGHVQRGEVLRKIQIINYGESDIELILDNNTKIDCYDGYSGSPLFINEMLVGIVQEQANIRGIAVSISASSFDMIKRFIPDKYCVEDKYKRKLKNTLSEYTENQINKNISIKKYIPEIFVENGNLKEKCRFMVDPLLFYKKIIEDIGRHKFIGLNKILKVLNLDEFAINIDTDLKEDINLSNLKDKSSKLNLLLKTKLNEFKYTIEMISSLDENNFNYDQNKYRNNINWISGENIIEKWIDLVDILNYKGILITEHAGQGKTNFICDLTKNVLLKKHIDTLYINAIDLTFDSIEMSIEKLILEKLGYDFESFISKIRDITEEKKKPFVIVIDGLNEHSEIKKFSRNIELFIEKIKDYNFIRLLMTCRIELFEERFENLKNYYNDYLKNINTLKVGESVFEKRIYSGYLNHFGLNNLQINDIAKNKLVKNTLLLRIFCETYQNYEEKDLPLVNDIYIFDLFEKYWESKKLQIKNVYSLDPIIFEGFLNKILSYMITNKVYSKIDLVKLNLNKEERDLLDRLLDEDILFRKDEFIKKGFLNKTVNTLSFVFDEFRDYSLSNFIMSEYDSYEYEEYKDLIKDITNEQSEVAEGISKYLFFESKKIQDDEFNKILKSQDWYQEVYSHNIFLVNDNYITNEDIDIIINNIKNNKSVGWYIMENLLNRYDEQIFKNLGITLLLDTIKDLDTKEYDNYIVPIVEEYINKKNKFVISKNDVKIDPRKHSLFKFIVTILNTNHYKYLHIYIEYTKEYLKQSVEHLKYLSNSKNIAILKNIRYIIMEIKSENILTDKIDKSIINDIEHIENNIPELHEIDNL